MGKKDRSLKTGAPASASSRADDAPTPEPYNCTGSFPEDFEQLWIRNCSDKDFLPVVRPRGRPPSPPEDPKSSPQGEEEEPPKDEDPPPQTYTTVESNIFFKPSIQCELDVEETKQGPINHAQQIHIKGWKIEEKLINVLKLCSLDKLSAINLWHAGLTEHTFRLLINFLPALPALKSVSIEGNAIPGSEPFADLLNKELQIQHLSLRNNKITDIGAIQIGKSLGTASVASPELLTLNLGFNHIGDEGAKAIAEGLRMNRVLTHLSLASNLITDIGAKAFASSLNWFDLTHDEIVQRRKLMSEKGISGRGSSAPGSRRGDSKDRPSSNRSGSQVDKSRQGRGSSKQKGAGKGGEKIGKKDDKNKKEAGKLQSKTSIVETPKNKNRKSGGKDGKKGGQSIEVDSPDIFEQTHPLLDHRISHEDGKVSMPGCTSLLSLNLSRNEIGVTGMRSLLKVVEKQTHDKDNGTLSSSSPGLMKLSLQKNHVPHDDDTYFEIYRLMLDKDPNKADSKTPDDDFQSVAG